MKTLKLTLMLLALLPTLAFSQATFHDDKDEFTGEDNSSVYIVATGKEIGLGWKCFSDGLNIILAHDYLGGDSDDDVIVRTKFDEDAPSERNYYSLSKNNRVTYFDIYDVGGFTKGAIEAEEVMLRITDPLDSEMVTGTFITRGLEDALRKLSCYP